MISTVGSRAKCVFLRRAGVGAAVALSLPLGVGLSAPAAAVQKAVNPQVRVITAVAANGVRLSAQVSTGQRVFVADVDPAGRRVSAPRAWTSDIVVKSGSQVFAAQGSTEQTRVVYGVARSGVITSREVLYNSSAVKDKSTGQRPTQWSVSRAGVSLSWWKPAGAHVSWTVSVDGSPRGHTSKTTWTDRGSDQTRSHTYTVTGTQTVTRQGRRVPQPYFYQVATVPSDDSAVGMAITDSRVRSAAVNSDVVSAAAYPKTQMIVSYRAFIAPQYIPAPGPCLQKIFKGVSYYGGDNRGYDNDAYGGTSSRLLGQSSVSFYSDSSDETFYRHVGTTTAYDKNHKKVKAKTASIASIEQDNRNSGTATRFEGAMTFNGGNPLCTGAPAINGVLRYTLRSNGSMRLFGNHDQAPNHEILYYWYSGGKSKTGCAYRHSLKTFYYLLSDYPDAYFDVSFNPKKKAYPKC